ncbi:hypothetical protein SINU_08170 [Sporolactobacillus inulinus CASD]|uniref:Uncharacterized protein n=1 Tax=Sporolactobacillus inulinus CASD TaxID=1069536 RepID=A0A0U1QNP8_9BACL|nr:hypothetical protein SINU_08170 [Sporolactobacillus inulinus CASD]
MIRSKGNRVEKKLQLRTLINDQAEESIGSAAAIGQSIRVHLNSFSIIFTKNPHSLKTIKRTTSTYQESGDPMSISENLFD